MYGQQSSSKAATQQNNANKPVAEAPQPVQAVTINEQQPEKSSQNANGSTNHAKSYLDMLSPENLPTTILALVGVVGIIVAVCTLKAIQVQAGLMEGQLREMQEAGKQAANTTVL